MKGKGLILETRVNKEDRGQHSRQGVKIEERTVTIGHKGPKRMTSCQQ